jgi:hypothetical protein
VTIKRTVQPLAADEISLHSIPTGPEAYLRHVVLPAFYNSWRQVRGGPRVQRRQPLQLSRRGATSQSPLALVAYLRAPFERPAEVATVAHPNWEQATIIADVLAELGYNVDVAGPLDAPDSSSDSYDLLIGELAVFTRCLPLVAPAGRRIYLATRRHPWWEYESVGRHLRELRQRSGLSLKNPLSRKWYAETARGISRADAVVSIGSPACASTYARDGLPIIPIGNVALFRGRIPIGDKDYSEARRHFLWLGSGPLANKGLAPVLFAFARSPHLHLWICGPVASIKEARTVWALRRHLFESENVHPVGWVDTRSADFAKLLRTCGWVVSASYSESMSSSIVLAVANGLVPIVVPEVGIDCNDYGVLVERPGEDEVTDALRRADAVSGVELRERSARALALGDREFTPAAFRQKFLEAMQQLHVGRSA